MSKKDYFELLDYIPSNSWIGAIEEFHHTLEENMFPLQHTEYILASLDDPINYLILELSKDSKFQ